MAAGQKNMDLFLDQWYADLGSHKHVEQVVEAFVAVLMRFAQHADKGPNVIDHDQLAVGSLPVQVPIFIYYFRFLFWELLLFLRGG